jgi:histone H3/H4
MTNKINKHNESTFEHSAQSSNIKQDIPLGSISNVITPVLNKAFRKTKKALIAFGKAAEQRTMEIVESISNVTSNGKRKTLSEGDVQTYFKVLDFTQTTEPVRIPFVNIVRLSNKVLGSEFRKTRPALNLIRNKVEAELRTIATKICGTLSNSDKKNAVKTITDVHVREAIAQLYK